MNRVRSLLVVLLVVSAGCLGSVAAPGDSGTTPDDDTGTTDEAKTTDAPTTDEQTTTTHPLPDGRLAPGVDDGGVTNGSRLFAAHRAALAERGFVVTTTWRFDGDGGSGERRTHAVVTPGYRRFALTTNSTTNGESSSQRAWMNETMTHEVVRISTADRVRYRTPELGPAGSDARRTRAGWSTGTGQLAEFVRGGDFAVTDVDRTGAVPRYTLVARNVTTDENDDERTVHLTVDADGVVRSLRANVTRPDGGHVTVTYRVHDLGVTEVDRPGWVADAPAPLDTRPTVGFENCTSPYLVLENPGTDAVPEDTTVRVVLEGTEHHVALDAAVAPGERRALYLTAAGDLVTAEPGAVPTERTAMPKEAQVGVVTARGLVLSQGGMGFGCATGGSGGATDGSAGGSSGGGGGSAGGSSGTSGSASG